MSDCNPKQMKILLVEDQSTMRKIEIKIFKELGFETIVEAEDGAVAIDLLQEIDDIDLIVSDWNMPNKGGYDLLLWVRAYKKYKDVPFIMATAQADREQSNKAHQAGVSAFIPKPFTADDFQAKVDELFNAEGAKILQSPVGPVIGSSGKVKLRVAHIQITDHLILGVLKDKIDKGEFTPKHFELETQCLKGWNPVEQALDKGSVDAAFVLAPIAQDLFHHGVPLKMTLLAHKNGSSFVRNITGRYAPPFANYFRNKSFLIPHKMSVHHMLTHMFFEKAGLKASLEKGSDVDVNLEVVAPVNMPKFLGDSPDVGGFMVAEPIGSKSVAAGITKMQFLSGELWDNHPCCVVAVRNDFSTNHTDAVYEFTQMLVKSGSYIASAPEESAQIAVNFLDPKGQLGLATPVIAKVLTTPQGITTHDLFPVIQDFETMQRYMHDTMGIGQLVDLEKFIDSKYAEAACQNTRVAVANFKNQPEEIDALLLRNAVMNRFSLQVEDKYLMVYNS